MTLRTRRWIFYTLVALFIIIGGGSVLYAQGWRLDFSTWKFEKIGGIYIRSYPQNASITLNGKPIQSDYGFLSPGTLISDLLPRTYSVSLKAPGYETWQENASVLPSFVVQFKYAVLIPANATTTPSSTVKQLTLASASSSRNWIDPYDPAQKIVTSTDKISVFDATQATTTFSAAIAGKNVQVSWITSNLIVVLQNDGELYLWNIDVDNANELAPKKLADDVKYFSVSDDGSMIAALELNSLEVFSLSDSGIYYRFNLPDVEEAKSIIWYKDLAHLFVVYPNRVSFLDLADMNLANFTTIAYGTKMQYDAQNNLFYITDTAGKVVQYQFPD